MVRETSVACLTYWQRLLQVKSSLKTFNFWESQGSMTNRCCKAQVGLLEDEVHVDLSGLS